MRQLVGHDGLDAGQLRARQWRVAHQRDLAKDRQRLRFEREPYRRPDDRGAGGLEGIAAEDRFEIVDHLRHAVEHDPLSSRDGCGKGGANWQTSRTLAHVGRQPPGVQRDEIARHRVA
jgi:hypothetical protein